MFTRTLTCIIALLFFAACSSSSGVSPLPNSDIANSHGRTPLQVHQGRFILLLAAVETSWDAWVWGYDPYPTSPYAEERIQFTIHTSTHSGHTLDVASDALGHVYALTLSGLTEPERFAVDVYNAPFSYGTDPEQPLSTPTSSIIGPHTLLDGSVRSMAIDSVGKIYVGEIAWYPVHASRILIFAPNSSGDVAPLGVVNSDTTRALRVDSSGRIYAAENATIHVFPAGQYGNVTPLRTISGTNTKLGWITSIALGRDASIYVRNLFEGNLTQAASVTVYAPGASGDAAPIRTIQGSRTGLYGDGGIAVCADGTLYVGTHPFNAGYTGIEKFAPYSNGNVAPQTISTDGFDPVALGF